MKKIIIIAGGTGGHVFSGLTIAHALKKEKWNIKWIGTNNHIESTIIPKNNIDIYFLHVTGFQGKKITKKLFSLIHAGYAYYQAKNIIKIQKPDVVLGMGSYISIPGILAAWSCNIPIVIHEQNTVAGLANKWLTKISNKTLQGFPNTLPLANLVGNPIRNELLSISSPSKRFNNRFGPIRILIMGGSQGAEILNTILPQVAKKLSKKLTLWHQVGMNKKILHEVKNNYIKLCGNIAKKYKIVHFIYNISLAYSWADLIICRSGAMTVSEIAHIGIPAIFIPYRHKDQQQYWNAKALEKIGAAKIIKQSEITAEKVIKILKNFNRTKLLHMANLAKKISIPNATNNIIKNIKSVTKSVFD
ncbi:UDP-N-acetylglucosamine--N-acetylmuramyl-(pentapeptide) pyrophosphoryl-undecaprenol N-acetylglucosamine transferase [Candidatus Westeberhardia cardiocondylae]|uniref:UDP-N-acetylglucosamine--N-acetylmuramyl-(pentapeptide) pyrophosphoryl-undecaprenol N-acetylglucosamine transferase n=1 Tax=Candidatus Westeberhardia cardiocondylae TaxID=1594731 RepID=A0A0H5C599_9ENTR|nr:undecaprenyldiphospho-muramoylpentapeptide beta-N-acetylglucosaminyltransferase [Candidatus Westeberhardia cardiocondylae]MCR3756271.1 N-acetylglucosaminyl transferase [Candidatus Westeberhardia cardiocondylae]CEN32111.1 UDP-N-acetylglucosamine--N-acetylmuramyl-(pentapeptide) pyrophosphoryl-undecaprenol N-acetylglucosamine transferase [Candidatus Westeberhardia cardiocondylae]